MNVQDPYTGIILAGGQSVRFGRDKGFMELNGKKMIEYAVEILTSFCTEIIISSNDPGYQQLPWRIVPDIDPGHGPMMGLYSALRNTPTARNLVLAVDNIMVTPAFYHYLLSKDLTNYLVAVPYIRNKFYEPLVGCYKTDCLNVMEQMMKDGNYKLPDLLSGVAVKKLMVEKDFPDFHPRYFQSLNNPEDLQLLQRLHHDRS